MRNTTYKLHISIFISEHYFAKVLFIYTELNLSSYYEPFVFVLFEERIEVLSPRSTPPPIPKKQTVSS